MSDTKKTPEEVAKVRESVFKTFYEGGSHAHNVICASLTALSSTNRDDANKIYADLQAEGY